MSFESDIGRFQAKIEGNSPKFVKQVVFQAYKMITEKTPVKTGRAKNNWFVQSGSPSGETTESTDLSMGRMVAEVAKITGKEPDIYISNNLDYIMALEHGHSQQAPAGMVQISVQQLKHYIESNNWEEL